MKNLVIIGAGNFGREVAQLIKEINDVKKEWNLLGYIDETPQKQGSVINNNPVLGGFEWLDKNKHNKIWTVCAIGSPRDKLRLVNKALAYNVSFANLIHPGININEFVDMGCGNIICAGTFMSINIKVGNHVAISPICGIGHDVVIEDFASLYWNVTLSGNVSIHEGCEIGSKSVVIPGKSIGKWSILGAGAVVIGDIPEFCTAVGVPAKPVKII